MSLSKADLIGLRSVEAAERATERAVFVWADRPDCHGMLDNIQEGNRWTNGRKNVCLRCQPSIT